MSVVGDRFEKCITGSGRASIEVSRKAIHGTARDDSIGNVLEQVLGVEVSRTNEVAARFGVELQLPSRKTAIDRVTEHVEWL